MAVLILKIGARRGWVVKAPPPPLHLQERDAVPIVREAAWAPGLVWMVITNGNTIKTDNWISYLGLRATIDQKRGSASARVGLQESLDRKPMTPLIDDDHVTRIVHVVLFEVRFVFRWLSDNECAKYPVGELNAWKINQRYLNNCNWLSKYSCSSTPNEDVGKVEVWRHSFLISALRGNERWTSHRADLSPGGGEQYTREPEPVWTLLEKRKMSSPARNRNMIALAASKQPRHYRLCCTDSLYLFSIDHTVHGRVTSICYKQYSKKCWMSKWQKQTPW